jgi:hypothetical protein
MDPWLGNESCSSSLNAARLIADGAWMDRSLGMLGMSYSEREAILAEALRLIDKDERQ